MLGRKHTNVYRDPLFINYKNITPFSQVLANVEG